MFKSTFVILFILLAFSSSLYSSENHYYKADLELQQTYEVLTGQSLKSAIRDLIAVEKGGSGRMGNDVWVEFAHGGPYIGRKNTLNFLVKNDVVLGGFSLGFKFWLSDPSKSYSWVEGYGDYPTGMQIIKEHAAPYNGGVPIPFMVNTTQFPFKIGFGGTYYPGYFDALPRHDTLVVLASMQLELPDDEDMVNDTFYIDNDTIAPALTWAFTDSATGVGVNPPPYYQGVSNSGKWNPDAPAVGFVIKEPLCQSYDKSSNPRIVQLEDWQIKRPLIIDPKRPPGLHYDYKGNEYILVRMRYKGTNDELTDLGAYIAQYNLTPGWLNVKIPIELLPRLCLMPDVLFIKAEAVADSQLDITADQVDCFHSINRDSLNATGDSVIIEIIDKGKGLK